MWFDTHIFCCTNRREPGAKRGSCAEKGSEELRDYMKSRLKEMGVPKSRVNGAGCLDRFELGPCVVIYPEGTWYSPKTKEDMDEILQKHVVEGGRVERLFLPGSK
jgi:(2Fe-2S) ferredoxin